MTPSGRRLAAPFPIIVGSPRSGTTLLRFMLDSHPELAIPPETGFLVLTDEIAAGADSARRAKDNTSANAAPDADTLRERFLEAITAYPTEAPAWPDFGIDAADLRAQLRALEPFVVADGFRLFYRMYAARFGKPRGGDKTPLYCRAIARIAATLPEAHFAHIMRDGRDAAVSLRRQWFSPGDDIETQARYWAENVRTARTEGARVAHYIEVRFEDLVRRPEAELRRLATFLELDFHPAMLRSHERAPRRLDEHRTRLDRDGRVVVTAERRHAQQEHTTRPPDPGRIGLFREALTASEQARFEEVAGDELRALGYPTGRPGAS